MQQIFLYLLVSIAFTLRIHGIQNNYPFWVDEFNSGTQARLIIDHGLRVFTDSSLLFEFQNITTHFIMAAFFFVFGQHEWVARLPIVIIGSLVPLAIFYLGKTIHSRTVGYTAAILATFSYFQIVWSRQARGYMLLQLLICATLHIYVSIVQQRKASQKTIVAFYMLMLIGLLTHYVYFIVVFAILLDYVINHRNHVKFNVRKPLTYVLLFLTSVYVLGIREVVYSFFSAGFLRANNIGYYHSFLWREYMLISFLALIGWSYLLFKKKRVAAVFIFYVLSHLVFITFLFSHHMSKYLLPIFPLLFIGSGIAITEVAQMFSQKTKTANIPLVLALCMALFIVVNGHKFVNRPKAYYSINHDFREIANIDYHQVYAIIKNSAAEQPAVIETWPGRAYWYLGNNYENLYIFRWENEEGYANGHIKKTDFYVEDDEKRISPRIGFIGNAQDIEKVIAKNKTGFLFIDDSSLPHDVMQYAEKNLKKELYLDHYPLDDNPYSIWPATLYSWGVQ